MDNVRNKTLDGWRGVAILLVVVCHAASSYSHFRYQLWANCAGLGVDIFFVISGYIITLHFIEERRKTNTIRLSSFYARRVFRILPLVISYLIVLCVVSAFVHLHDFHSSELLGSLLFFRNYQYAAHPGGMYTAQFWSLSIEEHFYLLWPLLLMHLGNKRALWLAVGGAITCAIWRAYYMTHADGPIGRLFPGEAGRLWRTDTRFDGLLLGCALALLLSRQSVRKFVWCSFPKETPLVLGILLCFNLTRTNNGVTLSSYILITLMLASTLVVEEGLVHKGLNTALMSWIGTLSFSIYVWNQMFLLRPDVSVLPLGNLNVFPFSILVTCLVATLSHYLIERPCIQYGKRLFQTKVRSEDNFEQVAAPIRSLSSGGRV